MKRIQSATHLKFIRSLPCLVCADNTTTEAAHIRFADTRAAKRQTGMGEKPDDSWAVPLCGNHHRIQHTMNEREFWRSGGMDPILVALALWRISGDHAAGTIICEAVHAA
jgi:hypothetical protein